MVTGVIANLKIEVLQQRLGDNEYIFFVHLVQSNVDLSLNTGGCAGDVRGTYLSGCSSLPSELVIVNPLTVIFIHVP